MGRAFVEHVTSLTVTRVDVGFMGQGHILGDFLRTIHGRLHKLSLALDGRPVPTLLETLVNLLPTVSSLHLSFTTFSGALVPILTALSALTLL